MSQEPETPSSTLVRHYLDRWNTLDNYILQEDALSLLFQKLCPRNKSIEHILLKVSVLNDFYSTNIYDTYSVSKHILELGIDEKLTKGDLDLVGDIAWVPVVNRTLYSFATKYCSHHQPELYPIFDTYVEKMLWYFCRRDQFTDVGRNDLRNFPVFVQVIEHFRSYYALSDFSLREIDIYLWQAGKVAFLKSYK